MVLTYQSTRCLYRSLFLGDVCPLALQGLVLFLMRHISRMYTMHARETVVCAELAVEVIEEAAFVS